MGDGFPCHEVSTWCLLACVVLLASCSAKRDFDNACRLASEALADKNAVPSERPRQWSDRTSDQARNPNFITAFEAIAHVHPADKYSLLVKAAEESGVPGWSCPSIRRLIQTSDADFYSLCDDSKAGTTREDAESRLKGYKPISEEIQAIWPKVLSAAPPERLALIRSVLDPREAPIPCSNLERLFAAPKPGEASNPPK
jgi:hypothetical protein